MAAAHWHLVPCAIQAMSLRSCRTLCLLQGSQGLAVDCEEAVLWLSRSARQLMEGLALGGAAEPAAADRSATGVSASAAAALCAPAPALLMTQGDCRRVLCQVEPCDACTLSPARSRAVLVVKHECYSTTGNRVMTVVGAPDM